MKKKTSETPNRPQKLQISRIPFCDTCERDLNKDRWFYHCKICNWDCCDKCSGIKKLNSGKYSKKYRPFTMSRGNESIQEIESSDLLINTGNVPTSSLQNYFNKISGELYMLLGALGFGLLYPVEKLLFRNLPTFQAIMFYCGIQVIYGLGLGCFWNILPKK